MDDQSNREREDAKQDAAPELRGAEDAAAPPRFSWAGLVVWLIVASVLGAITAWLAFAAQSSLRFAPLLLFPAIVGGLLGLVLGVARSIAQVDHLPTILIGTLLAIIIAVAGQHFMSYCAAQRVGRDDGRALELAEAAFPDLPKPGEMTEYNAFCSYMKRQAESGRSVGNWFTLRGPGVWVSWSIDAVILGVAAFYAGLVVSRRFGLQPPSKEEQTA